MCNLSALNFETKPPMPILGKVTVVIFPISHDVIHQTNLDEKSQMLLLKANISHDQYLTSQRPSRVWIIRSPVVRALGRIDEVIPISIFLKRMAAMAGLLYGLVEKCIVFTAMSALRRHVTIGRY